MLAERDIKASYETVRRWALKFGAATAQRSRYNRDAAAKQVARPQAFVASGRASGARTFGVTAM